MGRKCNQFDSNAAGSGITIISPVGERGTIFTDLLMGLCLSLLILGIMQQLTGSVFEAHSRHANQAELQYSARMALDCIERDLRCARDFQVSADGSKLMIWDADDNYIRILVLNNNLYRQDVRSIPVAENLSAVHFNKNDAGLRGKLELKNGLNSYSLDFFCFARAMKDQDEGMS